MRPHPGESRRGLGISCEPSTPLRRAERIAWARRDIIETSLEATPEALAHFCEALASDSVRAAVAVARNDHLAAYPPEDCDSECATPPPGATRTLTVRTASEGSLRKLLRCDSLEALYAAEAAGGAWESAVSSASCSPESENRSVVSLSESPPKF